MPYTRGNAGQAREERKELPLNLCDSDVTGECTVSEFAEVIHCPACR